MRTGIACKEDKELTFDLSPFIAIFLSNKLWERNRYRSDYAYKFEEVDLQKIKSIKLHIHTNVAPLSNLHEYETVINRYIPLDKISKVKLLSSGLRDVDKLAVVEIEFESTVPVSTDLNYEEEKNIDSVHESWTDDRHDEITEYERIQSITCDFIQFFVFNLHLNFLSIDYSFHWKDKPNPMGLLTLCKDGIVGSNVSKIDMLTHYILYDKQKDNLKELMNRTAEFWCVNVSPVHFLLESLKSDYISYVNFIQLLFTLESFFDKGISNDYITLVVPLLAANNEQDMVRVRLIIRECFKARNNIVHGNSIFNIHENKYKKGVSVEEMEYSQLFFELKNIVISLFYFCLRRSYFVGNRNKKITHDAIFKCIPNGIL